MSVSFIKKYHTCSICNTKDYELFAIAKISDISSGYAKGDKPDELKEDGIYVEQLVRDDYGIITCRTVKEKLCSNCNCTALIADKKDNETTVLNFYPQTDAHKWLDGMAKVGL